MLLALRNSAQQTKLENEAKRNYSKTRSQHAKLQQIECMHPFNVQTLIIC